MGLYIQYRCHLKHPACISTGRGRPSGLKRRYWPKGAMGLTIGEKKKKVVNTGLLEQEAVEGLAEIVDSEDPDPSLSCKQAV